MNVGMCLNQWIVQLLWGIMIFDNDEAECEEKQWEYILIREMMNSTMQ